MSRYAVVIERETATCRLTSRTSPGCVATGRTEEDVRANITEAVTLHLESLRQHGDPVPPPSAIADVVEVT